MGGWLISKYDIKVRRLLHICYIAPLICVFASLGNLLTCSETGEPCSLLFIYFPIFYKVVGQL